MASKFTCHAISDGSPGKGKTIGWCIVGQGRFYKGGFLNPLKDRARLEFSDAEFEESFGIEWGDTPLLRQGVEVYLRTKYPAKSS
jgi:hypothetical protein